MNPLNMISGWFAGRRPSCPLCGQTVRTSAGPPIPLRHPEPRRRLEMLCGACRSAIPWIVHPLCRICGRGDKCEDCVRRTVRHYALCRCAVRYDDTMKDWLALYKYRGHERLVEIVAASAAFALERLEDALVGGQAAEDARSVIQAITSVPLSKERLRERGFNQAECIAARLSEWYGIPYRPMLRRLKHTEKQSLKSRRSRVTDMNGIFALADTDPTGTLPSNLLLLDDVYTTGSTMNECARILREGGARFVCGIVWAR